MNKWGHLKLRKVLSTHSGLPCGATPSDWPVIGQFSSVGSLGPAPSQWVTSEWLTSLSASSSSASSSKKPRMLPAQQIMPPLKLIFPSVENVRTSLEGYMAGGSIPFAAETAAKQPYLRDFLQYTPL
jgi:tyrosyl-DNA phosphodiesterase-1